MSDLTNHGNLPSTSSQELPSKRKYEAPALSDLGSISALTRSVTPTGPGDGGSMRTPPCL